MWNDSVVDLRMAVERLEELECELAECPAGWGLDTEDEEELQTLVALREAFTEDIGADLAEYAEDEPTLINKDYWVTYVEELCEECGYEIPDGWPYRCIDWIEAARELAWDYTMIRWNGYYWYVRSV